MATFDCTFKNVRDPGFKWGNLPNLNLDGSFSFTSTTGSPLIFSQLISTSSIPIDITITGIQVFVKGSITSAGTGTPVFTVRWLKSDGTQIGSSKVTPTLTTTNTESTLGGTSDVWDLKRIYWDLFLDVVSFEVVPSGSNNVEYNLDYIKVRFTYTQNSYLSGNRSQFTHKQPNTFDSQLVSKNNFVDPIKSADVNELGDCLVNIETALLSNPNSGVVIQGGAVTSETPAFLFTMTVSGISQATNKPFSFHSNNTYFDYKFNQTNNFTSVVRTRIPASAQPISFNFVSAVGWLTTGGASSGLVVSPTVCDIFPNKDSRFSSFSFGFTAMLPNQIVVDDWSWSPSPTSSHQPGLRISSITSAPTGIVIVKILAIGRYS